MKALLVLLATGLVFSTLGCASGKFRERQQAREKAATTSGFFCEFTSGDEFPDVDVEVNLRMSKRCDSDKPFSISDYKNSSENFGVMYCCSVKKTAAKPAASSASLSPAAASTSGAATAKPGAKAAEPKNEDLVIEE